MGWSPWWQSAVAMICFKVIEGKSGEVRYKVPKG
jgi:hypothetical protein